jgi:hypothetical protein
MVAAESLASGLPVVATPSGGVDAIVGRDGLAGEIAGSLAPESLAAAIETTLERRSSFRPEALRAHVAERYGAPVVAAATLAAYGALPAGDRDRASTETGAGAAPLAEPPPRPSRSIAAVVALHRSGIRRVDGLPGPARNGLSVVTDPAPARELSVAVGRVVTPRAGEDMRSGGIGRLVRSVVRRREAPGLAAASAAVDAIRSAVADDPGWIVAADGDDVEPIVRAAGPAFLAPGSLRWLADRSDDPADGMAP